MEIRVKTIPHSEQRYDTCGDWVFVEELHVIDEKEGFYQCRNCLVTAGDGEGIYFLDDGTTKRSCSLTLEINVSDMQNPFYEFLVAMHEADEAMLCLKRGIEEKEVSDFDMAWKGPGEPGNSPAAPYHHEHFFATSLERLRASEMNVNWQDYESAIELL